MISKIKPKLAQNILLFGILLGAFLVAISISPYQNPDTRWEYEVTMGVIHWGMPYSFVFGNVMNQPPLGFYVSALFFTLFGQSPSTNVLLMTFFGLGSTVLVYKIGEQLYGKISGLFAAALFALTPWQIIITRSFLIDPQCLFFSLLTLFLGLIAIRKNSNAYGLASGLSFSAALLTKLFAVYALIPLLALFLYHKRDNLKSMALQAAVFLLPVAIFSFLWYQIILGGNLSVFLHADFVDLNAAGVVPSYLFVWTFLVNFGLSYFLVFAALGAIVISLVKLRMFSKTFVFDAVFLFVIVAVLSVDLVLGVFLNLKAPYTDAFKYDYQALPFICLIAGSLANKSLTLFKTKSVENGFAKMAKYFLVVAGIFLLASSLAANLYDAHRLSITDFVQFRVQMDQELGYSLDHVPLSPDNPLTFVQYLGFVIFSLPLLWAVKTQISSCLRRRPKLTI